MAPPERSPTPYRASNSTEQQMLPNGCRSGHGPDVRAQPARADRATAPVVEFSFARLVHDYPHPLGAHGVECPAYYPHAQGVWSKLTPNQKQDAVHAAPRAPGKIWLGRWLNNGRETGKFEIVEHSAAQRVWVRKDTPQWAAWVSAGRRPLTTQHRVDGELETGWMFETEWPPDVGNVERVGGVQ
jgi:hypothetical protein